MRECVTNAQHTTLQHVARDVGYSSAVGYGRRNSLACNKTKQMNLSLRRNTGLVCSLEVEILLELSTSDCDETRTRGNGQWRWSRERRAAAGPPGAPGRASIERRAGAGRGGATPRAGRETSHAAADILWESRGKRFIGAVRSSSKILSMTVLVASPLPATHSRARSGTSTTEVHPLSCRCAGLRLARSPLQEGAQPSVQACWRGRLCDRGLI